MTQAFRGCSMEEAAVALEGISEQLKDVSGKMLELLVEVDCYDNIVFCEAAAALEQVCIATERLYLQWENVLVDAYKPILQKMEEITDTSLERQDTDSRQPRVRYDIAQVTYTTLCTVGNLLGQAEQVGSAPESDVFARLRESVDGWLDDKGYEPDEVSTVTSAIWVVQDYNEQLKD